jgi:hypothetical protein
MLLMATSGRLWLDRLRHPVSMQRLALPHASSLTLPNPALSWHISPAVAANRRPIRNQFPAMRTSTDEKTAWPTSHAGRNDNQNYENEK